MSIRTSAKRTRKGFTLVELAVVIVIIGVLAAFGVPKFLNSVERSKAAEAFAYLSAVRDAQERYLARRALRRRPDEARHRPPAAEVLHRPLDDHRHRGDATTLPTWTLTLTRDGAVVRQGAYTVTFNQSGYDSANSTIDGNPEINPMGTTAAVELTTGGLSRDEPRAARARRGRRAP